MRVVCDIEANGLENPDQIWLVVCQDYDTHQFYVFRNITSDKGELERFLDFARKVRRWIGHNFLGYDYPVLAALSGYSVPDIASCCHDTLILSKLIDYPRGKHSIEDYGEEFGYPKIKFSDFSKYSKEMEEYCIRDVEICRKIYHKYIRYINDPKRQKAISLEHHFQLVANDLHNNGFSFNTKKAEKLLVDMEDELKKLDAEILTSFPPRTKLIREITPKATKHGTISLTSIPKAIREVEGGDLSAYSVDAPFSYFSWHEFNPASHKQIIQVLHEAGWQPIDKTDTHKDLEREINILKRDVKRNPSLDIRLKECYLKLDNAKKFGWKVNENNLSTLPDHSPSPARLLARRIQYESRRRTLTEWLGLVCTEIKIDKESIETLGRRISEKLIQSGWKKNENITERDIEKEISVYTENRTCTTNTQLKNKENDDTILRLPTGLLLKSLIEWLKNKKVSVSSVKEEQNCVWITVIPQVKSEGSYVNSVTHSLDGLKTAGLKFSITSERIKGRFQGIGAWTHRMAHQEPNTANIANEYDTEGRVKLLGKEMRQLWQAPRNRLLVGVDAEGIQLRVFAHYVNNPALVEALVKGDKAKKTDPHSYNKSVLGDVCKTRQAAKRFIYALFLGAGMDKLAIILECSKQEAEEAYEKMLSEYPGFLTLKQDVIPADAKRGWFEGLDGRAVKIPGDTVGNRRHLAMSGYLQNGEAVIMKLATIKWYKKLNDDEELKGRWKLVNIVQDEWQTEVPNNVDLALRVARYQADALREVSEELNLKCPMAGSFWNDDAADYTISTNWYNTH